jgi:hypothetical protein
MDIKPIHPDISTEKAWLNGRRVYVTCGYNSLLNTQMRDLGAKWDREMGALYTGTQSGKLDKVIALVLADAQRAAVRDGVKGLGLWVSIPAGAADIRAEAKKLGAVFDGDRKEWAMPSAETQSAVEALIAARKTAPRASRKPSASTPRRRKCDECGERWAVTTAVDLSGITGDVCARCKQDEGSLSFA